MAVMTHHSVLGTCRVKNVVVTRYFDEAIRCRHNGWYLALFLDGLSVVFSSEVFDCEKQIPQVCLT